jgi:hypothetical protein
MSIIGRLIGGLIAGFATNKIVNAQGKGVLVWHCRCGCGFIFNASAPSRQQAFDTPRSELNS